MLKRNLVLVISAVFLTLTSAAVVDAQIDIDTSSVMSQDDMIQALETLEAESDGKLEVFTLDDFGIENAKSEAGRDLHVAKIGNGDKKMWVHGRIHGDEPYGTNATLRMIKNLIEEKNGNYKEMMDELTIHFIPMYNPDGAENNERTTTIMDQETGEPELNDDGNPIKIDLNRDWTEDGFVAQESLAFYKYWADIKPDFMLDLHHQGNPTFPNSDIPVTMSLGISLAPGGPTLPNIKDGEYDRVTRQAMGLAYDKLQPYKEFTVDRYRVGRGGSAAIDIKGGLVSAVMLGLNYEGLNPQGHSSPGVFIEASGQHRTGQPEPNIDGEIEPLIVQNVIASYAILSGFASDAIYDADPERWYDIPAPELTSYSTDYAGTLPGHEPEVELDISGSEIQSIVERYAEIGKFNDNRSAQQLKMHLKALEHYEKTGKTDKVINHIDGFNMLIDHQSENDVITNYSHRVLKAYSDYWVYKLQDSEEEAEAS